MGQPIWSTNALIAALRSTVVETSRWEEILTGDSLDDEAAEEAGYYVTDLHEATAVLTELYETRRVEDSSLAPTAALLRSFEADR